MLTPALLRWPNLLRQLAPLAVLAWLAPSLTAAPMRFESAAAQTTLVELFTSEGCSSCPPIERWLSSLRGAPGLWTNFVPVAFHVDYWDTAAWRDPYAQRAFTERQRAYARGWGGRPVYTPGPVRNGSEWTKLPDDRVGPAPSGVTAGRLAVVSEDGTRWRATFTPAVVGLGGYELCAAPLVNGAVVEVKGGENLGRRLPHDFVALNLVRQPLLRRGSDWEGAFTVIWPASSGTNRLALAVWVTPAGQMKPLQATGGWLPAPANVRR